MLFNCFFCYSQKRNFDYSPQNNDSIESYIKAVSQKKIQKFQGKHQKEISQIIEERRVDFLNSIKDSTYIFDKKINSYLNSILRQIYTSNPQIDKKDFYFFINKSPIPNAACYGNGIFTINLGLFNIIESDDELAFIICHEIAHYILEHNDKSLLGYVETYNSKENKKKINKAANNRYGRRQAVSALVKDLSYNFLRRSRTAETQADSLGFVLLSKTKFSKSAGIKALKKLDMSNEIFFATDSQIRKHFDFETYPFKEAWLNKDETLFDLKEKADDFALDKDSIKTHPDMPIRVKELEKLYSTENAINPSFDLKEIKNIVAERSIAIFIDISRIDLALYQVLTLHNSNQIEETAYCNTVAAILKKTYDLKSSHKFGKYVSPVSPFSDEKYLNEVRTFLHNVELKNIRKIGLQFCMKYEKQMAQNPDFLKTTAFFYKLNP